MNYLVVTSILTGLSIVGLSRIYPGLEIVGVIGVVGLSLTLLGYLIKNNYFWFVYGIVQRIAIFVFIFMVSRRGFFTDGPGKDFSRTMDDLIPVIFVVLVLGALFIIWLSLRLRRRAIRRLEAEELTDSTE